MECSRHFPLPFSRSERSQRPGFGSIRLQGHSRSTRLTPECMSTPLNMARFCPRTTLTERAFSLDDSRVAELIISTTNTVTDAGLKAPAHRRCGHILPVGTDTAADGGRPVYSFVFLAFQGGAAGCCDVDEAETVVFIDRDGRTLFRAPWFGRDQGCYGDFHERPAAICDGRMWGYMNFPESGLSHLSSNPLAISPKAGNVVWDGRSVPIANDEILMPEEAEDWPEWPAPVPDDDRPASS